MKTTILALALASTFAAAAFAQSAGEKTGVNSALGIAPKTEGLLQGHDQTEHMMTPAWWLLLFNFEILCVN
jgi:hypothetical protein